MRPVDKTNPTGKITYDPYGNAKPDLINCIGSYCSYCERPGCSAALDVEHVEPKNSNPDKRYLWSNFLLACKNCNSIKGTSIIDFSKIVLPHIDNTVLAITYLESGFIKLNPNFEEPEKGEELIKLIGLDRRPGSPNYSHKDSRWEDRKKAWKLSIKYLSKFQEGIADVETIIDLAKHCGFFSIWFHIFKDYTEVQQALIDIFPGTRLTIQQ